jgi:hypothetical protein
MMMKGNRFFSQPNLPAVLSLKINIAPFIAALTNGDSSTIDLIVDATKNGITLDNNDATRALEILLRKHDFVNAKKLIAAGAQTETPYQVWVPDDYSYPYGSYETRYKSLYSEFGGDPAVLKFLHENPVHIKEAQATETPVSPTTLLP